MAAIWSLATLGSAVAANYEQLMLARFFIGVGEAAYGSVGLAVVLAVFPAYRRASLTGAFMAGGSFGSVLGVALGGALAVQFGWRWSFGAMAIVGLVLVVLYRAARSATRSWTRTSTSTTPPTASRSPRPASGPSCAPCSPPRRSSPPTSAAACSCSSPARCSPGCPATSAAPTACAPDKAAGIAAIAILLMGVGMIVCGAVTDRLSRRVADPQVDDRHRLHRGLAGLPRHRLLPAARRRPAAAARRRRLLRRRHRRPGRRDGRQPDPRVHPGHRVRHPHPGQQPARPGRRLAGHRHPRRPVRPRRRHEDRPDRRGRRAHRPADRPQVLRRAASPRSTLRRSPDERPRPSSSSRASGATSRTTGRPSWRRRCRAPGPSRRSAGPTPPAGPGDAAGPDRPGRRRPGDHRRPQRGRPGHRALGGAVQPHAGGRRAPGHAAGLRHGRAAAGVPLDRELRAHGWLPDPAPAAAVPEHRRRAAATTRWATRCGCAALADGLGQPVHTSAPSATSTRPPGSATGRRRSS